MPRRHFIQQPPLKTGKIKKQRRLPSVPRNMGDRHWERSVYFYWWAFLRLNEDYIATCDSEGKGKCAKLYEDFGDVRSDDFWAWWKEHQHLFVEIEDKGVEVVADIQQYEQPSQTIILSIPLDRKLRHIMKEVRTIVEKRLPNTKYLKQESKAKYKIIGKPVVAALAGYYETWKMRTEYPKLPYWAIYQITRGRKIDIEAAMAPKKRKGVKKVEPKDNPLIHQTQTAYRSYRIASQIIDGVGKGDFPLFRH